ncbi:MAG: DUF368 domain-containing protein [Desulfovibrionaceae bacterium]
MRLTQAWMASPGPRRVREAGLLGLKGFCMGAADVVPGVSGGTIAFITGIYDDLLAAIRSFDAGALGRLARLDVPGALARVHLRFLLSLLLGLGLAVVSVARLMHWLLTVHPAPTWALFFGLIAASIWVVGRRVDRWTAGAWGWAVLGGVGSWVLVGLIPVTTPDALWFVFLSGALAICAMILPGISGSYILLLIGKYEFVMAALRAPFDHGNLLVLAVFLSGAGLGIAAFSRLLGWLLVRFHRPMMALLTGFMAGAMRKIWPWKEVLQTREVAGKVFVLREANVLPPDWGTGFWLAVGLALVGAVAVLALERLAEGDPKPA